MTTVGWKEVSVLFEVAIVEMPTKAEAEAGGMEKLVFGPQCIVAKDAQTAGLKAARQQASAPEYDIDRAQMFVRPFA